MKVSINSQVYELPPLATLPDAIALTQATPPFAVAINMQFVPSGHYAQTRLQDGDKIDIIRPVTGG
jgi:sulfur carrier protein